MEAKALQTWYATLKVLFFHVKSKEFLSLAGQNKTEIFF